MPKASRTHIDKAAIPLTMTQWIKRNTAHTSGVPLCWRYLSSRAVSSQVLSAEASLTDLSRDDAGGIPNTHRYGRHSPHNDTVYKKKHRSCERCFFVLALPIFPGRLQPSIVSRSELNFRVRDGNGWTLALISTNYALRRLAPSKPNNEA